VGEILGKGGAGRGDELRVLGPGRLEVPRTQTCLAGTTKAGPEMEKGQKIRWVKCTHTVVQSYGVLGGWGEVYREKLNGRSNSKGGLWNKKSGPKGGFPLAKG